MAATSTHSFSELMRLSRAQTESQQASVTAAVQAREQKQQEERKKRLERDRKEKEEAKKRREKWVEQLRKEEADKERKRKQGELAQKQREEDDRQRRLTIMTGKSKQNGSKAPSYPSKKPRPKQPSKDKDDAPDPDSMLTREEKRQRRLQRQRASQFEVPTNASRRSAPSAQKYGKKLAGGVSNIVVTSVPQPPPPDTSGMSIKQRLSKMPMTLTKLNVNKRDTRTIDEILRDKQREKEGKAALTGDDARAFDGWFTPAKKALPTPAKASSSSKPSLSKAPPPRAAQSSNPKKRPASPTHSALPPPAKKSRPSLPTTSSKRPAASQSYDSDDLDEEDDSRYPSSEIWSLFGKDRSAYVNDDIFSDDEDMEAGASDLEQEEERSSRIARHEDELALRDEKRREDEKRKRKLGKTNTSS